MKTNFNSKLFEKQIDLIKQNQFIGGSQGSSCTEFTGGGCDGTITRYDDNGDFISETEFDNCN